MSFLLNVFSWASANWVEISVAYGLIASLARLIVKWTPTPDDDTMLEKIINLLKGIGLVVEPKK